MIRTENLPKPIICINPQIQEVFQISSGLIPKKTHSGIKLVALLKIKIKEKILKAIKDKRHIAFKETVKRLTIDLLTETMNLEGN